ncbi:hypothetical protein ACFQX4_28615, partial [Roseomonas sp. GCM10028921]
SAVLIAQLLPTEVFGCASLPGPSARLIGSVRGSGKPQDIASGIKTQTPRFVSDATRAQVSKQGGLITTEQVAQLGWTKTRHLATREVIDKGEKVAEASINAALGTTVRKAMGAGSPAAAITRLTFTLTKAQHATVARALKAFGASPTAPMPDRVKALVAICAAATSATGKRAS